MFGSEFNLASTCFTPAGSFSAIKDRPAIHTPRLIEFVLALQVKQIIPVRGFVGESNQVIERGLHAARVVDVAGALQFELVQHFLGRFSSVLESGDGLECPAC
jgi:hypothetical protein